VTAAHGLGAVALRRADLLNQRFHIVSASEYGIDIVDRDMSHRWVSPDQSSLHMRELKDSLELVTKVGLI
jgi:hypothetical protein